MLFETRAFFINAKSSKTTKKCCACETHDNHKVTIYRIASGICPNFENTRILSRSGGFISTGQNHGMDIIIFVQHGWERSRERNINNKAATRHVNFAAGEQVQIVRLVNYRCGIL